jgi:hypothetical protein
MANIAAKTICRIKNSPMGNEPSNIDMFSRITNIADKAACKLKYRHIVMGNAANQGKLFGLSTI